MEAVEFATYTAPRVEYGNGKPFTIEPSPTAPAVESKNRSPGRRWLVYIAIGLTAAAVLCALLVLAHGVVLAFFGAIVVAEALRPLVDRLPTWLPRRAAIAAAFAAALAALALVWSIPVRTIAPQVATFVRSIPALLVTLRGTFGDTLDVGALFGYLAPALKNLLGFHAGVAAFLANNVLLLLIAMFWLASSDTLRTFALSLLHSSVRPKADTLLRQTGRKLGAYVGGVVANGAIVATASSTILFLLGAPYPLALGLLEGLLLIIPYLGTLFSVLIIGAVMFATDGWLRAAEAMAAVSLMEAFVGSLIAPLIYQQRVNVDPLATVLATATGGALFGIGGVILAVPAAIVVQAVVAGALAPIIRANISD